MRSSTSFSLKGVLNTMGSLRTLLAIAVVLAHYKGFYLTGGQLAVQLFYIISGYLMCTILYEGGPYSKNKKKFYFNRFLRLYPVYFVYAFISLFWLYFEFHIAGDSEFRNVYSTIDLPGSVALIFSNIFIVGQDWIMFTGVDDNQFGLSSNFNDSEVQVWKGLVIPQAWTLGVEISFYLIAPFILLKKRIWMPILAASLVLRLLLMLDGIGLQDPFTYRFFPTELALFLLGAVSYNFVKPIVELNGIHRRAILVNCTVGFMLFYCAIYFVLPMRHLQSALVIICFIISLPILAFFQRSNKWDASIGKYSYPIYISHMLVIWICTFVGEKYDFSETLVFDLWVLVCVVLFSYVLLEFVDKRVESVRARVRKTP